MNCSHDGFHRTDADMAACLRERLEEANNQLAYMVEGIYRGNSISYIYDKMTCYGDQVMMAFNALRLLGWKDESNGNKERAVALKAWSESVVKERDKERAESLKKDSEIYDLVKKAADQREAAIHFSGQVAALQDRIDELEKKS